MTSPLSWTELTIDRFKVPAGQVRDRERIRVLWPDRASRATIEKFAHEICGRGEGRVACIPSIPSFAKWRFRWLQTWITPSFSTYFRLQFGESSAPWQRYLERYNINPNDQVMRGYDSPKIILASILYAATVSNFLVLELCTGSSDAQQLEEAIQFCVETYKIGVIESSVPVFVRDELGHVRSPEWLQVGQTLNVVSAE